MSVDPKHEARQPGKETSEFGVVTEPGVLRLERVLPGPIERVWAYLTESEKREKWLSAGLMELRVGGRVDLKFRLSDFSAGEALPENHKDCEVNGQDYSLRSAPPAQLYLEWRLRRLLRSDLRVNHAR